MLRSFFNLVNLEILKRSRPPSSTFDFRSASVGNLFLTGARLFSGSFESAIYLLSSICGIPDEEVRVIPSINSNFSHHIAAELEDGSVVVGQNSISHPVAVLVKTRSGTVTDQRFAATPNGEIVLGMDVDAEIQNLKFGGDLDEEQRRREEEEEQEDAHPPFTLPTLRTSNIAFTKDASELSDLPARISRLYYVNSFGQEILPPANPRAIQAVHNAQSIIYSIGSLYTSIVPNLVLRGMGEAMRRSHATTKILILNGCLDREVGPESDEQPFTAASFIDALVKAGEQSRGIIWSPPTTNIKASTTATNLEITTSLSSTNRPAFNRAKSETHTLSTTTTKPQTKPPLLTLQPPFPPPPLSSAVPTPTPSRSPSPHHTTNTLNLSKSIYTHYITHLIHLPNTPPNTTRRYPVARNTLQCKMHSCVWTPEYAAGSEGDAV